MAEDQKSAQEFLERAFLPFIKRFLCRLSYKLLLLTSSLFPLGIDCNLCNRNNLNVVLF